MSQTNVKMFNAIKIQITDTKQYAYDNETTHKHRESNRKKQMIYLIRFSYIVRQTTKNMYF